MPGKLLEWIYTLSVTYKKQILSSMGILTLLCAALIPGLKISSSHQNLISADHPEQAKYLRFLKEFGAADNLVVVLDGDSKHLKQSADLFANEIRKETKWVRSLFYKIDSSYLLHKAPLFIPLDQLKKGAAFLRKNRGMVKNISQANNLQDFMRILKSQLSTNNQNISPGEAVHFVNGLRYFFDMWNNTIKDPKTHALLKHSKQFRQISRGVHTIKSNGYLLSNDYKLLFLFVQPTSSNDELHYLRPFISSIRSACNRVFTQHPELKDKIKVAFTGMPAHVLTENNTIISDVGKAGIISVLLVALILLSGFKSVKKLVIAIVPLLCGIIITLGFTRLAVGRLNLISSAFLAVLFGIGIDFGIYLIRRTEEELGNGLTQQQAVHRAVVITGKSILTGGLTTAMAFLAIAFSDFSGYSELGITAGSGILIVLAATFLIMPALLLSFDISPRKYTLSEDMIAKTITPKRKKTIRLILIPSLIVCVFSIYAILKVKMDYNVLNLLPKKTESTDYQVKMETTSDFQMSFAAVTVNNLDSLKKICSQIKELPETGRIDSLGELIPGNQLEKITILKQFNWLRHLPKPQLKGNTTAKQYISILTDISSRVLDIQDIAFSGGQSLLVKKLEKLNTSINSVKKQFEKMENKKAIEGTQILEKNLFAALRTFALYIPTWLSAKPVREKDISPEIINRFKNKNGTYVAYIFPNGSIWNLAFLDRFVTNIKKITSNVTGFPVTHRVYVRQAANAVIYSTLYSLIIVILILLIDFKKISAAILALVPLMLGMLWLQSALFISGIPYNVANIAGLPLLLGLGVVYGVHIVHRWLEKPELSAHTAAQTTGRGVAFAALTTISGLFSIIFARHNGVSTFGFVLLFGISLSLLAAVFALPAIIDFIYHVLKNRK